MESVQRNITAGEIRDLVGSSPVMLEIGAHEGADTVKFLAAMPDIALYCFEPDDRAAGRFKQTIGDDPRVVLIKKMVADVDGEKLFWASTGKAGNSDDWDYSGSPNEPTGHRERSPTIMFKPPVFLPSIRLDTWIATMGSGAIDFAWVDVQGSQRSLIAGGEQALARTRYLYIECHHPVPLYRGEPSREELMALLPGFEPLVFYATDNIFFKNRNPQ